MCGESHRKKSKKVSFSYQMHYTLSWRGIMSINITYSQHYYIQVHQDMNISFQKERTESKKLKFVVHFFNNVYILHPQTVNVKTNEPVTLSRLCWLHLFLKPNNLGPVSVVLLHFISLYAIIRSDVSAFFTQVGIYLAFFKNYSFAQLIPLLCTFSLSLSVHF